MPILKHDVEEATVLADGTMVMCSRPGRIVEEIAADLCAAAANR